MPTHRHASDTLERQAPRKRVNVLGVGIDAVDTPAAIQRILDRLTSAVTGYVCVTGVHGIMEACRDPRMRTILNESSLTTPDGMPSVWVGRLQGYAIRRVYGPDLMIALCSAGVAHGLRHYFYGGTPGVAETLRQRLCERIPGLQVVGTYTPPFRPLDAAEADELMRELAAVRADVVWVGLSTPKQERFMAGFHHRLARGIMIGVGAAFDIHAGRTLQAPRWMQRSGLEWLFRLLTEPRRLWKRYLVNNPLFIVRLLEQLLMPWRYPAPR